MNPLSPSDPADQARFEQLRTEADRLYEADDFTAAIPVYRAASLLAPLDANSLTCLACAEEHEPIAVYRRMTALWPDSFEVAHGEMQALFRAGYPRWVVQRCTDWLMRSDLTPAQIRWLRADRLAAALRTGQPGEFAADFLFLWDEAITRQMTVAVRLLWAGRTIAEIGAPKLLEPLAVIGDRLADDPDLTRLIISKVEQLTILRDLKAARTVERIAPED